MTNKHRYSKTTNGITIREAIKSDIDALARIVGKYRGFYGVAEQDMAAVKEFIGERIRKNESVILMAVSDTTGAIVAFSQLFPVFSTVSLKKQWLLNDFYVEETRRNKGVGSSLMEAVKDYFRGSSKGFILVTAKTNIDAKRFYDKHGWKTDAYDFYTYFYERNE